MIGSGELEIGKPVPSWTIPRQNATVLLSAQEFVPNGRPDAKLIPKPLEPRENGERGAVVEVRTPDGKATVNLYRNPEAFEDETAWVTVQIKDRLLKVRLASEELQLPFAIRLEDFVEPKIPGTNQAAMYTSIVTLKDEKRKIEEKSVITMNRPLRHTAASDEEAFGGFAAVDSRSARAAVLRPLPDEHSADRTRDRCRPTRCRAIPASSSST